MVEESITLIPPLKKKKLPYVIAPEQPTEPVVAPKPKFTPAALAPWETGVPAKKAVTAAVTPTEPAAAEVAGAAKRIFPGTGVLWRKLESYIAEEATVEAPSPETQTLLNDLQVLETELYYATAWKEGRYSWERDTEALTRVDEIRRKYGIDIIDMRGNVITFEKPSTIGALAGTVLATTSQNIINAIQRAKDTKVNQLHSQLWRENVTVAIPQLVENLGLISVDEALAYLPSPNFTITSEDRAYAQQILYSQQEPAITEEELRWLLQPTPGEPLLATASVKSIVEELYRKYPDLPAEEFLPSVNQAVTILRSLGIEDELVQQLVSDTQIRVTEISNAFKTLDEQLQLYKAQGIPEESLPPTVSPWTAPFLAIQDILELWYGNIVRPLVAIKVINTPYIGLGLETDSLKTAFIEARQQGMGDWQAYRYAYDHWDTNWGVKLALETLYDPTTYLGFGLYSGTLKGIKFAGVGKLAEAGHKGFIAAANLPFDTAKYLLKTAGPKVSNVLHIIEPSAFQIVKTTNSAYVAAHDALSKAARDMGLVLVGDSEEVSARAIDLGLSSIADPTASKHIVRFGQMLRSSVKLQIASFDDLAKLSIRLGGALHDIVPKAKYINYKGAYAYAGTNIHHALEEFLVTRNDQRFVELLLHEVKADFSPENIAKAREWLADVISEVDEYAQRYSGLMPADMVTAFSQDQARLSREWLQSDLYHAETFSGAMGQIANTFDWIDSVVWRGWLDQNLVVPFATSYLAFGFYGLFNTLESIGVCLINKVNPFSVVNPGTAWDITKSLWPDIRKMLKFQKDVEIITGTTGFAKKQANMFTGLILNTGVDNVDLLDQSTIKGMGDAQNILGQMRTPFTSRFKLLNWVLSPPPFYQLLVDAPSMLGGMIRQHYVTQMTKRYFLERIQVEITKGNLPADILDIIPNPRGYNLPKEMLSDLPHWVLVRAAEGEDILALKNALTGEVAQRIKSIADFQSTLSRFNDIITLDWAMSNIADLSYWDDPAKFVHDWKAHTVNTLSDLPETMIAAQREFRNMLTNFVPRGAKDIEQLYNASDVILSQVRTYPRMVQSTIVERAEFEAGFANIDKVWDKARRVELQYIDETVNLLTKLNEVITNNIDMIESKLRQVLRDNIALYEERKVLLKNVRKERAIFARKYWAEHPNKTPEDLKLFYKRSDKEFYNAWQVKDIALSNLQQRRVLAVKAAGKRPMLTIPTIGNKHIPTISDLATVMTGSPDELVNAIINNFSFANEDAFVEIVKGYVDTYVATSHIQYWTDDAIRAIHHQIKVEALAVGGSLDIIEKQYKQIDAAAQEVFNTVSSSRAWFEREASNIDRYLNDAAEAMQPRAVKLETEAALPISPFTTHQPILKQALRDGVEDAVKDYHYMFADYDNVTIFNYLMRHFFPYWTYETYRWQFLFHQALQHPGLAMGWGRYMCVPQEYQILTKLGWKYYSDLVIGEEVLVVNPVSLVSYWEKLTNISVYDYDGELLSLPYRTSSVEYTPDHRWLVLSRGSHIPKVKVGRDLVMSGDLIPRAIPHLFATESIISPRDAALIGWWVTDGSTDLSKRRKPRIVIHQSEKKYLLDVESLVGAKGANQKGGCYRVRLRQADCNRIFSICPSKSDIVSIIPKLNKAAAEAMWDAMFKAEGYEKKMVFTQNKGAVSDAFQMLSLLLGKAISVSTQDKLEQTMILRSREYMSAKHVAGITKKHYKGKIWCPTTPSGTWIMKTPAGRVLPTGNSYSDGGYIHMPGTDLEINPLRGTVLMGGMRRLMMQDFPEFMSGVPGIPVLDGLSRFGFYPGIHVLLPFNIAGQVTHGVSTYGELIPALPKFALDALSVGMPVLKNVARLIVSDRFRDYNMIQLASKICQQRQLSYSGYDIWRKQQSGEPLTEEEADIWETAQKQISAYDLLFEQTSVFRLRPQERLQAYQEVSQAIYEKFGITPEQQDELRKRGARITDVLPPSVLEYAGIYDLEQFKYWVGLTTPLLPAEISRQSVLRDEFWATVRDVSATAQTTQVSDDDLFLSGKIDPGEWQRRTRENQTAAFRQVEAQKQQPRYTYDMTTHRGVPITLEERADYFTSTGNNPGVADPLQELKDAWYDIKLAERVDYETGVVYADWDAFFAQREALLNALTPEQRERFLASVRDNESSLVWIYQYVNNIYLRTYWRLDDFVLKHNYTDDEKKLIREYFLVKDINPARATEILSITRANGNQLLSNYQLDLNNARKKFRAAYPIVDYWLWFFHGGNYGILTPTAQQMQTDWGRDVTKSGVVPEMQQAGYYWEYEEYQQPVVTA